jgi:hypothetical protein
LGQKNAVWATHGLFGNYFTSYIYMGVQRLSCVCHTHFPPLSFFSQGSYLSPKRKKMASARHPTQGFFL